jgi:hypothetical protein
MLFRLQPDALLSVERPPALTRLAPDRRAAWMAVVGFLDVQRGQATVRALLEALPPTIRGRSERDYPADEFLEQAVRNGWLVAS